MSLTTFFLSTNRFWERQKLNFSFIWSAAYRYETKRNREILVKDQTTQFIKSVSFRPRNMRGKTRPSSYMFILHKSCWKSIKGICFKTYFRSVTYRLVSEYSENRDVNSPCISRVNNSEQQNKWRFTTRNACVLTSRTWGLEAISVILKYAFLDILKFNKLRGMQLDLRERVAMCGLCPSG